MKKIKGSTVQLAKPIEMVKPIESPVKNIKQAIQGEQGKAQGYLGKFAHNTPETGMTGKKQKKKGVK